MNKNILAKAFIDYEYHYPLAKARGNSGNSKSGGNSGNSKSGGNSGNTKSGGNSCNTKINYHAIQKMIQ